MAHRTQIGLNISVSPATILPFRRTSVASSQSMGTTKRNNLLIIEAISSAPRFRCYNGEETHPMR